MLECNCEEEMKRKTLSLAIALMLLILTSGLPLSMNLVKGETITHGAVTLTFDDGGGAVNTPDRFDTQYYVAWPLMKAKGIVGTFYVITGQLSSADFQIMHDLQNNGNEIASHSVTHPMFSYLTEEEIREECSQSKQTLQSNGFTVNNFAYPYGDSNPSIDAIVSQYYRSGRYGYGYMNFPVTTFQIISHGAWGDENDIGSLESQVDYAYANNKWLILMFHDISGDPSEIGLPENVTPEDFGALLDYIQARGMPTLTVNQGLDYGYMSVNVTPTSVRLDVGQSQTFSSSVEGGNAPYSYQWYLNGSQVPGAHGSTWTFTPTPSQTGHFNVYVSVTDNDGFVAQSNTVTDILVYAQPSASIIPSSVNLTVNATQQFTSTVTGGITPYTYKWYYSNGTAITGATASTLTFKANSTGTYSIYLNVTDNLNYRAKSNTATINVYSALVVSVSPTHVSLYYGGSQTFTASVAGGAPGYGYQWYLNGIAVSGATGATWMFTPRACGNYLVYVNVTDSLNNQTQSNTVSDIHVYSVNLQLTAGPNQTTYKKGTPVTFEVDVFNQLNPSLQSTLSLTVTGPGGHYFYDIQPVSIAANGVSQYSFSWTAPNVAGTYVIETSLAPSLLTAYDAVCLKVH
jgi:peptidoglycan/xylan/chitin deacetylase (PgdA/CDA1 family)